MVAGFRCKNFGETSFLQALQTFLQAMRAVFCQWLAVGAGGFNR